MGVRNMLVDLLRRGADKKALGPMEYYIEDRQAFPGKRPRPTGGGDLRDRKIAEALRRDGA